jgi:hypothetical protein
MFDYKPERSSDTLGYDELGSISGDFEAFKADPKYQWGFGKRMPVQDKSVCKVIVPKTAPKVGRLPEVIEKVLKQTWKFTEPKVGAQRGQVFMGTRGMPQSLANVYYGGQTYHQQVRPIGENIPVAYPTKTAIASDWKLFEQIERTNAVTFRGDSRPPREVLQTYGGFTPPNSRTDRYYLENNIYAAFASYLKRRYERPLQKEDFLRAVDTALPTPEEKHLLIDYLMWRKVCEGESMHLGRMISNECLKGYVSTSPSIDTATQFAIQPGTAAGWVYVTLVHSGFVVPWGKQNFWGQEEGEVAQWGAIPTERIVGFAHYSRIMAVTLDSPIFIRRSFRKREPEAFEKVFKILSGKTPS